MLTALHTHENGRADIGKRWAPILQQRLLNQPAPAPGLLWTQGLADHRAEQDGYDATTQTEPGRESGYKHPVARLEARCDDSQEDSDPGSSGEAVQEAFPKPDHER